MRIVYAGCKERGLVCLKALLKNGKNIAGVVTNPDGKDSNGSLKEDAVKIYAKNNRLKLLQPENINSTNSIKEIKELKPDLIVLASYNQIIKTELINTCKKGIINLHGGKLPEYRGASVMNWQIIKGETEGGIAIIKIDEDIDTGDILAQKTYPILFSDTIKEVIEKTLKLFPELFIDVIDQIEKGIEKPVKQNPDEGAYYGKRTPKDGRIDFKNMTAKQIYNYVRALTHPLPGAYAYFNGLKVYIWKASVQNNIFISEQGKLFRKAGNGVICMAKDKGLMLEVVQEEGKSEMPAKEYFSKMGGYLS